MFKRMQHVVGLALLGGLLFTSCAKEEAKVNLAAETLEFADFLPEVESRSMCDVIKIPAGSTNALAQAVEEICENGTIFLKTGMHTETEPILISKPIKLIGEDGSVLRLPGEPKPLEFPDVAPSGNTIVQAGLHFKDAPGSLVQDIEIQPIESDGNTAILMENSDGSGIIRTKMNRFQFGILVEKSDRMAIMFNNIVTTSRWQSGELADAHAITVINGKSAYIAQNEVSNSVFGIWGCDEYGTMENNNSHDNFIGYILCNVPIGRLTLPDGSLTGAIKPAGHYKVRNNVATNSIAEGYLVIDGANNNRLENNAATNSGTYDMELTTATLRFGFPVPEAYKNTVIVGNHPDFRVKDCGTNNTISGGVLVDTGADPCN